jgi:hypothetical protein
VGVPVGVGVGVPVGVGVGVPNEGAPIPNDPSDSQAVSPVSNKSDAPVVAKNFLVRFVGILIPVNLNSRTGPTTHKGEE